MAAARQCLASLARLTISPAPRPTLAAIPRFSEPSTIQIRHKATAKKSAPKLTNAQMNAAKEKAKRKRRQQRFKEFKYAVASKEEQYTLMDAMRYIRAVEVGQPPSATTYEIALKIRTTKNGPVVRSRIRLPHPVKNDTRIAVFCKEGSNAYNDAKMNGAVAYGEESLLEMIKNQPDNLPFNRLICHTDSEPALKKANLGRILGPKGMMPSLKTNTITRNIRAMMSEMVGAENYREKIGVVRMPIGNINFTPKQLADNVKALVTSVKNDIDMVEEKTNQRKELIEVVLSSTHAPGFPLHGGLNSVDEKLDAAQLSSAM